MIGRGRSDSRSHWMWNAAALWLLAIVPCSSEVARAETPLKEPPAVLGMGSLVPVSHSISKTRFCAGEPVTARMSSRSSDGTGDRINYVIGGVPGSVVALTYDKPGNHQVLFAASDGNAIDQQSVTVQVRDCGSSFEYVTVQGVPLAFENDTIFYTAVVKSFGPIGRDNRSKRFIQAKDVAYAWEFGDGTAVSTNVPYVNHSYAERDERSTLNSSFITTVEAHANGLPTPIGRTTVTLPNLYKANLNNGKIVPKVAPARAVAQTSGGYTANLEVNNLEAEPIDLSSAIVMPVACDGTDVDGKEVEVASILSETRLPPGKSSLVITIPAGAIPEGICRVRYEVTGRSADQRAIVLVAAVLVRDPPLGPVDTGTPEYRARVKVVETAMRALGRVDSRGNLSGTISDAEIYELQLKGILGKPGQPAELPVGCGQCTANQICRPISTFPVIVSPGQGTYAVKGDVAFLQNPKSEIGGIIGALAEKWTHTGIMVDGNNCRSDLMGGQAATPFKDLIDPPTVSALVSLGGQATCLIGSHPVGELKIHPADLYQGSPGVITQAMYDSSYFYPYGVTLAQPPGLASAVHSPRWTMRAAADTANGISQRYGIYSYSDWSYAAHQPSTYELYPGTPSGHSGCSGFVMRALAGTTKTLPNFALNIYSATVRQNAANAMHNRLFGGCDGNSSGISDHIYDTLVLKQCSFPACPSGSLTQCQINKLQNSCNGVGTGIRQWTEGLLNQIINCFAFGDVGNGGTEVCSGANTTAWMNPGTGSGTISPDSVYNQMGTKYSATYVQEVLYPTVWGTGSILGCVTPGPVDPF